MSCKNCISGTVHEGTPTGTVTTLHGLPAYVAEPPSGNAKGIIVIIPDAFGWEFINNRVLADSYAKKGDFRVYLPDFMNGKSCSSDILTSMDAVMADSNGVLGNMKKIGPIAHATYHFVPFLYYNRQAVARPRIFDFFKALRQNEAADLPLGAAGFCWGGRYATLLCHDAEKAPDGKSLVDVGFIAHPSLLVLPDDIELVRKPLSIAVGTRDNQLSLPKLEQIKAIFAEKEQGKFELVVYEGAMHGFAVRGNPNNRKELEQGREAEDQAVAWFTRWLGRRA